MWLILQHKRPDDFVISTGRQTTVKNFINLVSKELKITIKWKGKGLKEKGFNSKGFPIIECDKNYFRPLDVNTLLGSAQKARKKLKWKPQRNINTLIDEMILAEYNYLNES